MDLSRAELPSCTISQSVNFFMDKDIQQHTTDSRYVCINCNDQGSSVLINAISEENGLISALFFILQLAGILERLNGWHVLHYLLWQHLSKKVHFLPWKDVNVRSSCCYNFFLNKTLEQIHSFAAGAMLQQQEQQALFNSLFRQCLWWLCITRTVESGAPAVFNYFLTYFLKKVENPTITLRSVANTSLKVSRM